MKRAVHRLVGIALAALIAGWLSNDAAASEPTSGAYTFVLHPKRFETDYLRWWDIELGNDTPPKEPAKNDKHVLRCVLLTGVGRKDHVHLWWDAKSKRLLVDQNRNHDLTDEKWIQGTASYSLFSSAHIFRNIEIPSTRGPDYGRAWVNIELRRWSRGDVSGHAHLHSGWEGEVDLGGKRYLLAYPTKLDGTLGTSDSINLRPVGESMDRLYSIPRRHRLFLNNRFYASAFELQPSKDGGRVVSQWQESPVKLVECEIAGKNIARLEFTNHTSRTTHILDRPGRKAYLPPGEYWHPTIYVDAGPSIGILGAGSRKTYAVSETTPTVFQFGAPLRNTIDADVWDKGHILDMTIFIRGADDEWYSEPDPAVHGLPRFVIYKWGFPISRGALLPGMYNFYSFEWRAPAILFGDIEIRAIENLGELGPRVGEPTVVHIPFTANLPRLAPWFMILALSFLPSNRGWRPKAVPLVALLIAWMLSIISRTQFTEFGYMLRAVREMTVPFQGLSTGIATYLLVSVYLQSWKPIPNALVGVAIIAAVLTLVMCDEFSEDVTLATIPLVLLTLVVYQLMAIVVPLLLGRGMCRRKVTPFRLTAWTLLWSLLLVALSTGVIGCIAVILDMENFHGISAQLVE